MDTTNLTYHDQVTIDNVRKLREVLQTLPPFARDYFRAIEPTTSARTRISYAYDIRIFFNFLLTENPAFKEKTMSDMNGGVEAFRAKLESLGVKNIGIYVGTYFMEEHSINTEKFTALWIPTYGTDNGYYNAAPKTDIDYDLHQYTSQGTLTGFSHPLDLNQISTLKNREETHAKLFGKH